MCGRMQKKKTKLQDELVLFAYIRIHKRLPDQFNAKQLVKGKSWRTIERYLDDLQECMDFHYWDLRYEWENISPKLHCLYRNAYLLREIMNAAEEGRFWEESYPQIFERPRISAARVQDIYEVEVGFEGIPLRDVQRDIHTCMNLMLEIQEMNGKEDVWGFW